MGVNDAISADVNRIRRDVMSEVKMKTVRYCKDKCTRYGKLVRLYQDGPMTPLGMISWRCPECGLYDFEFPEDTRKMKETEE